jgi:hypothetical protein
LGSCKPFMNPISMACTPAGGSSVIGSSRDE